MLRYALPLVLLISTLSSPAWAQDPSWQEHKAFASEVTKAWNWSASTRVRVVVPTAALDARKLERLGLAKFKGLSTRPWVAFTTPDTTVLVRKAKAGWAVLMLDRKTSKIFSKQISSSTAKLDVRFQELTQRAPAELVIRAAQSKDDGFANLLRVVSLVRPKAGGKRVLTKVLLERQTRACPQIVTTQQSDLGGSSSLPKPAWAGLDHMKVDDELKSVTITQSHYLWLPEGPESKTCKLHGPSVTRQRCFMGKGSSGLLCAREVETRGSVALTPGLVKAAKPYLLKNKKRLKSYGFSLVRPKK